jgi:phage gp36-like protein
MSETKNETSLEKQLNEEQLLIANHFLNSMPMRDLINIARQFCIESALSLKDKISKEQYNNLVKTLKEQEKNEVNQEVNQDLEEIEEDNGPTIIMPK